MNDTVNWHAVRVAFDDFLENVTIVSKDTGRGPLKVFAVQKILLDEIFRGLVEGIHWFVILKARQLGVSTIFLLLDIFWGQMFPGLQGAIIAHDGQSMDNFRDLLTDVIDNLPPSHQLTEAKHNRNGVLIGHGAGLSKLAYMVAGTQKKRGALGRSRALNYCHMTEVSSYGDDQGFTSLKDTFSARYPYRLYCQESTARGFNLFHDEWEDAGDDTLTKRQIFLAWWMHDQYRYERGTALFDRYGYPDLSEEETKTTAIVARDYGHAITLEQWAWYRRRGDPRAKADFKDTAREDREEDIHQEYPSYPEEAFIATGSPFIAAQWLSPLMRQAKATLFKGYRYRFGENVTKSERVAVNFAREAHLKIFQEPIEGATYIVSGDAAYASSPESDRYCAQVIRCYSDKVEQVAVFCDRNIQTFEFTWVIVDLCAYYGNCRYILEINASGEAVMTEFLHLRTMLQTGKLNEPRRDPENPTPEELAAERSTRTMLSRVRTYLYRRPDSLSGGYNIHWKALALETPIPIPSGWTTMGELRPGDLVFDDQGIPCRVTVATETQYNRECYRVVFDDQTEIIADKEHLWRVEEKWNYTGDPRSFVVETDALMEGKRFQIRMAEPLQLVDADLPIHPYILGVWLGDGHSDAGRYSAHKDDIEEMSRHLSKMGATLGPITAEKDRDTCYQQMTGLVPSLRAVGVLNNKHIPGLYLRASFEQRLWLMQGLMDTDGSISAGRQCSFTTTRHELARGFFELARTLGIKAKYCIRDRVIQYKGNPVECATAYQFYFTGYRDLPIFRLRRKRDRCVVREAGVFNKSRRFKIVEIGLVPSVPVRCIQVDSPSQLYLAGRGMVPTHNTTFQNKYAIMVQYRDRIALKEIAIADLDTLTETQSLRQDGISIQAEGKKKDDRPVALALAVRAWLDQERSRLLGIGASYEAEQAREKEDGNQAASRYMMRMLEGEMALKRHAREQRQRFARKGGRWAW